MIYEIKNFTGLSDYEDRGVLGAFKFGSNLDVRKSADTLSAGQAMMKDESQPSTSLSPSTSPSFSPSSSYSATSSPSASQSATPSASPSTSVSLSPSATQDYAGQNNAILQEDVFALLQETNDYLLIEGLGSPSPTISVSPSLSPSLSVSATKSASPSLSQSQTPSASVSATSSASPSTSVSASRSNTVSASRSYSATPSVSVSASESHSPSASPSVSPSVSESVSISASISRSPSRSPSPSSSVSASPSPPIGQTETIEDLILWFVKSVDGYTYGFGDTGIIYKRRLDGYYTRVYQDTNGRITGAAEWYNDNGDAFLYWATDTKLHRKPLPGQANWNDVEQVASNLDSATWHTMRESGGSLIIANNDKLALVGRDESFTNEAVKLVPGNVATTIVERNGRTIVGCARKSDPSRSVNAAIDAEVPLAQIGLEGEVIFANMSDTVPVKAFPGGGRVNPGGVTNDILQVNFFEWEQTALSWIDKQSVGNLALFGVYDADAGKVGIYSYGRKNKNKPFVMNLEHAFAADEIGALENVEGTILASYREGSNVGVLRVDVDNKAVGTYEGLDFKAPMKFPVDITNWKTTEVFCAPLPTGASIEFWYKMNKTGSFIQAKTGSGATSFTTAGGKKAVFRIGAEGEIFEPKLVLNPVDNETPEVHRIRTYFA